MKSWKVPSNSTSGKDYTVRQHADGRFSCECRGWMYCKTTPKVCSHITTVRGGKVKSNVVAGAASLGFVPPMLAAAERDVPLETGHYWGEEKYNGHRRCIRVRDGNVTAWSRLGNVVEISRNMLKELNRFPDGTYDGEEIKGSTGRSYDVKRLDTKQQNILILFDVTRLLGQDVTAGNYLVRRGYLSAIFLKRRGMKHVRLAEAWPATALSGVRRQLQKIWDRDGEGIILKDAMAIYRPGRRSPAFVKFKQKRTAVLTVVGFSAGKGKIINRGPYAIALLEDEKGCGARVKIRNNRMLDDIIRRASFNRTHPFIGRKMRIEYQERTPDGGYFHPHCDRWEDE